MVEIGDYGRIEDFIALAKEGKTVNLTVELGKKLVCCPINTFILCVIPAEAGIQNQSPWIPVYTGMTKKIMYRSVRDSTLVAQKVPPGVTEDMKDEVGMYLLIADYFFTIEKNMKLVSKIYMFGSSEESPDASKENASIANARLKIDYQRLKDAGIELEEKYF